MQCCNQLSLYAIILNFAPCKYDAWNIKQGYCATE